MSKPATQTIDISQLPLQQLNALSQQLEQEIEFLANSVSQLKMLQGKFSESQECVKKVGPKSEGKTILVPLTGSMYVEGQLSDTENVILDIGTGYYVEKSRSSATEYFQRKVEYLTKQIEKLQPTLQEKYRMKQAVVEMVQMKVQSQLQQQGASTSAAK